MTSQETSIFNLIRNDRFFRSRDYVRGTATTPQAAPNGVRIFEGEGYYYLLQNFQTVFGVRPGSYAVVTGVLSSGIKSARDVNFTTYSHLMWGAVA